MGETSKCPARDRGPASAAGGVLGRWMLGAVPGLALACAPAPSRLDVQRGDPFIAVYRSGGVEAMRTAAGLAPAAGAVSGQEGVLVGADTNGVPAGDRSFYIGIKREELGKPWFFSAYLKLIFPGEVSGGAGSSLGTRVVAFSEQNGKLFVFDVDRRKTESATFDPTVVIDAYPIVHDDTFELLPGASDYVLFDPAAGLNRYSVLGDAYAAGSNPVHFTVDFSFSQNFRAVADGVTFEQLFSGHADSAISMDDVETNAFRASGTLGIGLRRYQEGHGFKRTAMPATSFFFPSDPILVPDTGATEVSAVKWNIYPGMKPITWVISSEARSSLASDPRLAGYDLVGALKAGVENWNEVFGFKVLEAREAKPGESFDDDDLNFVIYDTDVSLGAAFANWRTNPNTGEIRGASVYFNAIWLEDADLVFSDDPPGGHSQVAPISSEQVAPRRKLSWDAMPATAACDLVPLRFRPAPEAMMPAPVPDGPSLSKKQKVERYLTHVLLHEIGHTLGLRHNFKGSLVPPSSSVMDYLFEDDAVATYRPGSYDRDALRYLYGLSSDAPKAPFCTDEDVRGDPECRPYDTGADPLSKSYVPYYGSVAGSYLQGFSETLPNTSLNNVLGFVRGATDAAVRLAAWNAAIRPVKVALTVGRALSEDRAARTDTLAHHVLSRLFLDPAKDRGSVQSDVPADDPNLAMTILLELKSNLLNVDHLRSFETRRVVVDILKKLQTPDALVILDQAEAAVAAEVAVATLSGDKAQAEDLLDRIRVAKNPYFQ